MEVWASRKSVAAAVGAALGLLVAAAAIPTTAAAHEAHASGKRAIDTTNLKLGDGKLSSSPQRGYLWECMPGSGTSPVSGPWIHGSRYDLSEKPTVDGAVSWPGSLGIERVGEVRRITTNDLPVDHTTGIFPIQPGTTAYEYDRNPNRILAQSLTIDVPYEPRKTTPSCVSGDVGVMISGVLLLNAIDADGDDAVAHEIQDGCSGHPQETGQYHYHGLPSCIDTGSRKKHSKLIGYALDGFPIYGPRGNNGEYLKNKDLNACHGHTHKRTFNGEKQRIFHHHATYEFPYTAGCFEGTELELGPPPR